MTHAADEHFPEQTLVDALSPRLESADAEAADNPLERRISEPAARLLRSVFMCSIGALNDVTQAEGEAYFEKTLVPVYLEASKLPLSASIERIAEFRYQITGYGDPAVVERAQLLTERSRKARVRHLAVTVSGTRSEYSVDDLRKLFAADVAGPIDWHSREGAVAIEENEYDLRAAELAAARCRAGRTEHVSSALDREDIEGQYLLEIGDLPLLQPGEELNLAKRIEAGLYAAHLLEMGGTFRDASESELKAIVADGVRAQDHFWRTNLRLVPSEAQARLGKGLNFLDLIQEGNQGIHRAIWKFDYTKGYKFSTYATQWIRQAMGRAIENTARIVRLPVAQHQQVEKVMAARRRLIERNERPISERELAMELHITEPRLTELLHLGRMVTSLDLPVDEERTLGELVAYDDDNPVEASIERKLMSIGVQTALSELDAKQAAALRMHYGLGDEPPRTDAYIQKALRLKYNELPVLIEGALAALRERPPRR